MAPNSGWRRRTARLRGIGLFAVLILIARSPAAVGEGAPSRVSGPVIRSISFQVASPYPVSYEELVSLVTVRPGMPLTPEGVRSSIRGLYAKSSFSEISAYAREERGRIDLLFFLRPLPVVQEVEVTGAGSVGANAVVAASRARRGSAMTDRDYTEYERAVRETLRRKGFTEAAVSVSATCGAETGGGKVRIDVREGAPARVLKLEARGAVFFEPGEIDRLLGVAPGDRFDFRKWEEGVRKLRRAYKQAGFLTVRISEPETECGNGEGFCLVFRVDEGTRYELTWDGNRAFSAGELEKASGIFGIEETTEGGLVHDLRSRLLAFYREKGYSRAEVDVEAGAAGPGGVHPLRISIREGIEGYLKEIRFEGNAGIPSGRLRDQMVTRKRGVFHLLTGSGKLREDDWNSDLAAIVGLYQKEGYIRARIVSVDNVYDAKGGLTEVIHVSEGPRYRLREIAFRGNDHFLRSELLALMTNREGRFVDYVGLERDQEAIATYYRDAGYLDARVRGSLAADEADRSVTSRFEVVEGPRYRLGKVAVRGNLLTDAAVVLRELTIARGAPAGEKSILAFQQAVYGTGLYKSVRLQRVKNPAEGVLDLIVEVDETLFFEVNFGAGYGTDTGVRGFVETKHGNLNGKGRALTTGASLSEKDRKVVGDLREPWIFGPRWKWEGGLAASDQQTDRKSFRIHKTSVLTSITRTVFDRSSVSIQYELSRDRVFGVAPGAVISPEDQGSATIGAVRTLFILDFRDDPFNPHRGSLQSGAVEYASYLFGSEVDYYKVTGQSSWYFPVLRRNTFVVSGRAGYIRALRTTLEVPIQKRFFLGGRTTVRGFREETLGPKGPDGVPTGGDSMVNGNFELRVPLRYGFVAAVFLDAGSVWLRSGPFDRIDLRKSAGTGLRYVTPIGPVALDYAWKLDRREGESPSEWHFTIGAVF